MVHENWRFRPYYRRLRQWIDEGVVGDVVSVRLDFHSSGMIPGRTGAGRRWCGSRSFARKSAFW